MTDLIFRSFEFRVSGWYDQIDVGYIPNDGSLNSYQTGPGLKLFGQTHEKVLVECVCASIDSASSPHVSGTIFKTEAGKDDLFSVYLPLPHAKFEWLWATLSRCQNRLSEIEVAVRYAPKELANPREQVLVISGAAFTLTTGEYFTKQ